MYTYNHMPPQAICFSVRGVGSISFSLFCRASSARAYYKACSFISCFLAPFRTHLTMQMTRQTPVMQPSSLRQHPREKTPVKQPPRSTTTTTMGSTNIKKNFLILSVHLKIRKQGRLQKDVHSFQHMYSENCEILSSAFQTCSFTKSIAVLKVSCACVANWFALSWIVCTALFTVLRVVSSALFTDVEIVVAVLESTIWVWFLIWFSCCWVLLIAVSAALLMVSVAVLMMLLTVLVKSEIALVVVSTALEAELTADEVVSVTVLTALEMAPVMELNPKQLAAIATMRTTVSLNMDMLVTNSILLIRYNIQLLQHFSNGSDIVLYQQASYRYSHGRVCMRGCQATQKGYRKSLGRQASILGGEGTFMNTLVLMAWYSTYSDVGKLVLVFVSAFSCAWMIWYWGFRLVPIGMQQKISCRFWFVFIVLGTERDTQSLRLVEAIPSEPMWVKAAWRLAAMSEVVPMQLWIEFTPNCKLTRLLGPTLSEELVLQVPSSCRNARLIGLNTLKQVDVEPVVVWRSRLRGAPTSQPLLLAYAKLSAALINSQLYLIEIQEGELTYAGPMSRQEEVQSMVVVDPLMKNIFICLMTLHWLVLPTAVHANDAVSADTVVLDEIAVEVESKTLSWVGSKLLAVQNEEGFSKFTEVIEAVEVTQTRHDQSLMLFMSLAVIQTHWPRLFFIGRAGQALIADKSSTLWLTAGTVVSLMDGSCSSVEVVLYASAGVAKLTLEIQNIRLITFIGLSILYK